jgi:hypothetical protein
MSSIMYTEPLEKKIDLLPENARHEVADFVEFLLNKYPPNTKRKPRAGCMKGTFTHMSEDFNAALDDFKDYQ